jgi:hypothetical protein
MNGAGYLNYLLIGGPRVRRCRLNTRFWLQEQKDEKPKAEDWLSGYLSGCLAILLDGSRDGGKNKVSFRLTEALGGRQFESQDPDWPPPFSLHDKTGKTTNMKS